MSEGREAIEKLSSVDHVATELRLRNRGGIGLSDELIVKVIRLYGFVHEDDVVEGRMVNDTLCPCKKTVEHDCNSELAIQLDNDCNDYNDECFTERPATVKDLIG